MVLNKKKIITISCAVVIACVWYVYQFYAHAMIYYLDVGQGDATLIHVPPSTQMLVDCAKNDVVLEALGRHQAYYDRTIEYLVLTHADLDHYGGCISVLERFNVKKIFYNGLEKNYDPAWQTFKKAIEDEGAELVVVQGNERWEMGQLYIRAFGGPNNQEGNNASVILQLFSLNGVHLLTGDAEAELEKFLSEKYGDELRSDVYKVGHHGSKTSSTDVFMQKIGASVGVISAGEDNQYGHPHARVVARLKRYGLEILETSVLGDIDFVLY